MITYNYDRKDISAGIVHFGVGNFHRAHLEYYTNILLEDPSQHGWGVYGAMIMPSDERLYRALREDSGIYDLTVCSPSGKKVTHRIGSLVGLALGAEDPQAIIGKIASPDTKIISLTITEGGYKFDPGQKNSVFWYVAEGLSQRMAAGLPITILSCDNLQHNGDTAAAAFSAYFALKYPALAVWAEENVTYPNSMVDRITPATKSGKITDVRCEDFIQWVIEDRFAAGRPQWEKAGVQFTDDVTPYENMKLSLLNASHTFLSYPSYLEGYRKVDAVLADSRYRRMIRKFMDEDMSPYVPAPDGIDIGAYKDTLMERFSNPSISDQVSRLCGDGAAKFAVYVVPTLSKMLRDGRDMSRMAFLIANYGKYLMSDKTETNEEIEIFEPHLTESDKRILASRDYSRFLGLSPFAALPLRGSSSFMANYEVFCHCSAADGLEILMSGRQ